MLVAEAMLVEKVKTVVDKLIDRALAGSIPAARLCLDRTTRQPRDRIELDIPTLRSPSDVVDASAALVAAVAVGEVSPRAGKNMMAVLGAHPALLQAAPSDAPDQGRPEAQGEAARGVAEVEAEAAAAAATDEGGRDADQPSIGNRRARRRSQGLAWRRGAGALRRLCAGGGRKGPDRIPPQRLRVGSFG